MAAGFAAFRRRRPGDVALFHRPAVVGRRPALAALHGARTVRAPVLALDGGVMVAADGTAVARSAGRARHPVRRRAGPADHGAGTCERLRLRAARSPDLAADAGVA